MQTVFRSLIVYAICVPLAIMVGYLLTNPLDYSTAAIYVVLVLLLVLPLLLRWHYPLLLFSLNTSMFVAFIKGDPDFWMVMVMVSLGISVLERALNSQKQFIYVPQMTWSLVCMLGVVFMTAKLTGGFGLHSFGSEVYGGKKYIWLFIGILSYFALTARRISPPNAKLYASLFLLGGVTSFVGDFYPITPPALRHIYLFFPPSVYGVTSFEVGQTRLGGVSGAAATIAFWLAARHGLRGIFLSGKKWRPVIFIVASMMIFLGGFRIKILSYIFIFGVLFYLEGLHRTKWLLVFALAGILGAVAIVPLAPHLPFTAQRALAFLPLDISPEARMSADDSTQWRIDMWKALLPQIPPHLLLGKGYSISMEDFQSMGRTAFRAVDESQQGLALSGDYHNGPLSVIIPFGIWGGIVFLWLTIAGMRVMYCNYRYGDESLRTFNTFFWASYLYFFSRFFFIYGGFNGDMMGFASMIGFSIALNGGVCRPAPRPVRARTPMVYPAKIPPQPRPAFHH
jgi:O-Antigen ligase